jgi:iron(III) transport system ATP-binding protein
MSHAIAVMHEGRIVQIGSPRAIYERPRSRFVAEFIGSSNFVDATVLGAESDFVRVRTPLGDLLASSEAPLQPGAKVTLSIRPEDAELSETPFAEGANLLAGVVDSKVFQGDFVDFQIRAGGTMLLSRAHPSLRTAVGGTIHIRIAPAKCVALGANAESI